MWCVFQEYLCAWSHKRINHYNIPKYQEKLTLKSSQPFDFFFISSHLFCSSLFHIFLICCICSFSFFTTGYLLKERKNFKGIKEETWQEQHRWQNKGEERNYIKKQTMPGSPNTSIIRSFFKPSSSSITVCYWVHKWINITSSLGGANQISLNNKLIWYHFQQIRKHSSWNSFKKSAAHI